MMMEIYKTTQRFAMIQRPPLQNPERRVEKGIRNGLSAGPMLLKIATTIQARVLH